jgi:putative intracellular protease/amidase
MPNLSHPLVAAWILTMSGLLPIAPRSDQSKPPEHRLRNVAIVIFQGVELLDFAGPGEVFSAAHGKDGAAFKVYTVAQSKDPVSSLGFVTITPQYTLEDCPRPDIVVVPGGQVPSQNASLREWLRARSSDTELMMSVCNGAVVYAAAGLLRGLEATTHHGSLQEVALLEPEARVYSNRRFVDNGRVLTAAGISAGIDGALHVVERFCGEDVAWQAARYMEYDWRPDEIAKLHAQPGTPVENEEGVRLASSVRRLGIEAALAEYRKLARPPTEGQITKWGYMLLRVGNTDAAVDAFRLLAGAFPASANAMDSLAEALEAKSDTDGAKQASRASLALLEKDTSSSDERRQLIRNSSSSRIARLSGAASAQLRFVCPPCDRDCDKVAYLEAGHCPNCSMQLVERAH